MPQVQVSDWVGQPREGYVINAVFSGSNAAQITQFLNTLKQAFGEAVYCMPSESLHITVLDWIAPLMDYNGQDKGGLYAKIQPSYESAMSQAVAGVKPFQVHFTELRVTPNTIILVGTDDGQFSAIRQSFLNHVELLEGAKQPPQIIHSSLARFVQPLEICDVEAVVARQQLDFTQTVSEFRLVHTITEPMKQFEVLKRYELHG